MVKTCSIPGCLKKMDSRGWCQAHYMRWRIYGDPLEPSHRSGRKAKWFKCSIEGCERDGPYVRGWCSRHYDKWKRWGDPLGEWIRLPCSIEGCDRPSKVRGWCKMHYSRWQVYGEPGEATPRMAAKGSGHTSKAGYRIVTVDGCKIKEHRHVMGQMLGRPVRSNEDVHHKNGVKDDNRPENLELWVKPGQRGQRVVDLVAFVVENYRDEVTAVLA